MTLLFRENNVNLQPVVALLYMKDAHFRYQLIGKTEAELRGGGVRWWRGVPSPLLTPSTSSQPPLHWDGLRENPPPYSEKAPS